MGPRNAALALALIAESLFISSASGQDTYTLTALPPTVNAVTHGAIGAPFFTETHSSTPGTLSLDVVTNNNTRGTGTIKVTAPTSVDGTLDAQANLRLSTSSQFTVNAAISNTNFTKITAFVSGGARSVEATSLPLTLDTITAPTDTNTILFTVWVDFTLPLTPGSQFSYSYIRYEIVFKWTITPEGGSCPVNAQAGKDTPQPRQALACKDEISIDASFPNPALSTISAIADQLPPFCAFGKYSMKEGNGVDRRAARVQLYVVDDKDRVLAQSDKSPTFFPGAKLDWGELCNDKTAKKMIIIPEKSFNVLRQELLWPDNSNGALFQELADHVLGKLRLFARLYDAVTLTTIARSTPITFDIVPGGKMNAADLYLSVGPSVTKVPTGAIFPNADAFDDSKPKPNFAGVFGNIAAQASGFQPFELSQSKTIYLRAVVDFPGSVGNLDAEIIGISSTNAESVGTVLTVTPTALSNGPNTAILLISGMVPRAISALIIEPRIELPTGQKILFQEITLPFNDLSVVSVSPDNRKCSPEPEDLANCFQVKEANNLKFTLSMTPATTVGRVANNRQILKDSNPIETVNVTIGNVTPVKNQTTTFTHEFQAGPFGTNEADQASEYRIYYALRDCAADPKTVCAGALHTYRRFLSKAVIAAFEQGALARLGSATLSGVKSTASTAVNAVRSVGTSPILKKADDLLNAKLPPREGTAQAAADPELLWLNTTWQFSPVIPRNGSFSSLLTLNYTGDSFPGDPNFSEGKIQIVSIDAAGTLHVYPTTVDNTNKQAAAQIDSLDPYYGLAIVGPFARTPLLMASAATGYSLVNAGPQSASLQVSNAPLDDTAASVPVTLAAVSTRKTSSEGWVSTWSDSTSVAGVSWQETGKLLAVAPAGKPDVTFLLPGAEYTGRKTTEIQLANPNSIDADVTAILYNADGTTAGTYQAFLPPGRSSRGTLQTMFPRVQQGFIGYVLIRSQIPIAAGGVLKTAVAMGSLTAQPLNPSTLAVTTRFAPVMTDASTVTLHLVNVAKVAAQVTLQARNSSGASAAASIQVPLAPGQQYTNGISDIFGDVAVSSITAVSSTIGVLGDLLSVDAAFSSKYLVSLPLTDRTSANSVLPYITSTTTVAAFNPGGSPATVTVTPYTSGGAAGSLSTATVPAGGRALLTIASDGFAIIRSTEPLVTAGLVTGSTGGTAGYPAIGVTATGTSPGGTPGPTPAASAAGVLNAASFGGGAISPGEIVTVFGSNIGPAALTTLKLDATGKVATSLGEARVLFDDVPGAMIYTLAGQNSVVVPYSVAGKSTTKMVMEYQGRRSDPITLNVAAAAPALFSANSSGTGPGAILNFAVAGSTVNTPQNPIDKGGIIILYGTGEGVVTPPNQDGDVVAALHTPVLGNAKVTIGGINANVLFTGSAPSLVAGVLQINVEVPANAPAGNQPVVVTIGNFSSQAGLTVAIKGTTSAAPAITVDPTSLDFGTVTVNQTKDLTLTVRNTGAATLNLSFLTSSNPRFTPAGAVPPINIAAGASQNLTFRFSPTAAGQQTGTITISNNDPARPSVTVNVSGTGAAASTAPAITLDSTSLDFGTVTVGQTKDLTLTVRNTGTAALTVSSTTSSNARFLSTVGLAAPNIVSSFNVGPGSFQTVGVRFAPSAAGAQTGVLTLATNDPAKPTVTMNMSGTGASSGGGGNTGGTSVLTFDIAGIGNGGGVSQAYGDNVTAPVMGNFSYGGQASTPNVTVQYLSHLTGAGNDLQWWSNGYGDLQNVVFNDPDGDTGFRVVLTGAAGSTVTLNSFDLASFGTLTLPAVQVLDANGTPVLNRTNVSVPSTGHQTITGPWTSTALTIVINTTGLGDGSDNIGLDNISFTQGTGSGGGTGTPSIEATPATLDFGSVTVGQSITKTITLKNNGTAALNISFLSSSNAQFAPIDSFPPFTLQPGGSQTMTFRFTPTSAAAATGTITISSNDPVKPSLAINVTGTGTASGGGGGNLPTITFGQTINGTLSAATPGRSVGCPKCYADTYQITLTAFRNIDVRLNSTAFDAFLTILDSSGNAVTDDDSGGGTNARVTGGLNPGVYRIEASTVNDGETGAYTLLIAP